MISGVGMRAPDVVAAKGVLCGVLAVEAKHNWSGGVGAAVSQPQQSFCDAAT